MAELGDIAIMLGLLLALYASVGSVLGCVLRAPELIQSARRAAYLTLPVAAVAAAALVIAFLSYDFSIDYVWSHSNRAMDRAFVWVAFYAGNEGSMLLIALMLAGMSALAIHFAPRHFDDALPYTVAVLMGVLAFFFMALAFFANPFAKLDFTPVDGNGINPLLEHPGMFIHPPLQMTGLVGVAVPFAFVTGALIAGKTRDEWVDLARVSGILTWAILGAGMLVGAWWAYTILGWGGYWSWDPIENVALMPWLALTAFIHSIMVQKRRGMFRMWNVVLLSIAFVLAQFGMFINRGGPVVSVHSFGASALGMVFLGFMLLSLLFALAVFFWRYPMLQSDRPLESFLSREASFLVNNFLLLGILFVTLWGVIFPLFSEFAQDTTVTVAAPYYNHINGPLLLGLVFLMGAGPVLPWRRATTRSIRAWLLAPSVLAIVAFGALLASGLQEPIALIAFSVFVFVLATILEEWIRGVLARRRAGDNWLAGYWRMLNGNRARHGGYIVHLSILMLAFGIVGTGFYDQRTDAVLRPGESATLDNYRLTYVGSEREDRADRTARWANLDVYDGDKYLGRIQPWRASYPAFGQTAVRAAIRSNPVQDLYVTPSDFLDDGRVVLRISINPLAWWLWVAGPFFILGTVVALWPQPARELRAIRSAQRIGVAAATQPGS